MYLEKASNEFKIQSDKKKDGKLAFTGNAKIQFFKFGAVGTTGKDAVPETGTFIALETLKLGLNTFWDKDALKGYPFTADTTAENLFNNIIARGLSNAIAAKAEASADLENTKTSVENVVKAIRDNSQETGGFEAGNKEKKLKFFLNTLIDKDASFKDAKVFRLTTQGGDKADMSAKEEFTKTFFEYIEHPYNGKECAEFISRLTIINTELNSKTLKSMASVKNKLSEGVKYFEAIKKEYEAISNRFVSAAKSMSTSTDKDNEAARNAANALSGTLDGISKVTSWYTSNVINTYAIADLCIGKSAANLIGALNLGTQTLSNVELVKS